MRNTLSKLIGIDPRALACFRIGLAVLLLIDLAVRSHDLVAHYCDRGAVPRTTLAGMIGPSWRWSLHALSGSAGWEACLFAVAAVAAGALLAGWHTRVTTCVCWALLISLHNRNPFVLNGADTLLRMFLFWAMFLPLGHVWSCDARRRPDCYDSRRPIVAVASACLLIQFALTYAMAGYFKWNPVWQSGAGLRRALACDAFTRPPARMLLDWPQLTYVLDQLTMWGELLLPPLLFVPFATRLFRAAVMLFFLGMHVGIEATLAIGMFSYTCLAGWFLFLPAPFWNRLGRLFTWSRPIEVAGLLATADRPATEQGDLGRSFEKSWWESRWLGTVAAVMLGVVLLWNLATTGRYVTCRRLPLPIRRLAEMTLVLQKWNMFDRPPTYNTWSVVAGHCHQGRVIDLRHGGGKVHWSKPPDIARLATTHRWRKYFRNLARPDNRPLRAPTCRYLAACWNATHDAGEAVVVVDLYLLEEIPVAPGGPYRDGRRLLRHEVIESHGAFLDTVDTPQPAGDALPPGV